MHGVLVSGATDLDETGTPLTVDNLCTPSICAGVSAGNLRVWEAALDELHLGSAVSPALGAGIDLITDVDGTCCAGRRDIGPDSL